MTVVDKNVHYLKNNKPVNFKTNKKFDRTQDLLPVSEMVYTLMMWNTKTFLKSYKKNKFAMLHGRKYYFPVSKNSSLIVKNKEDLLLIETILKQKNKKIEYDNVLKV